MEKTLISRSELAERWGLGTKTIEKYEQEGVITRVPKISTPRYTIAEIEKIEGIKENPLSPLERKKLEREIAKLSKVIDAQRKLLQKYAAVSIESAGLLSQIS